MASQLCEVLFGLVVLNVQLEGVFVSVAQMWPGNKKFLTYNIICASALRGLWKMRNDLCFPNVKWKCVEQLIWRI